MLELTVQTVRHQSGLSVRRLARCFEVPVSCVGRWIRPLRPPPSRRRPCPVSGRADLRAAVRELCLKDRCQTYGYRRIWALLRRRGWQVARKTVLRIMRELGLSRPKVWHRPSRPKRVERMRPTAADQAWQIDMTSLQLADLTPLFLVVVTDCYTRELVGWTLDRRCRASEWTSAVRMGLESRDWQTRGDLPGLILRSDNGAQPCSKRFVEYLGSVGIQGQYTGYNAPDDKDQSAYCTPLCRFDGHWGKRRRSLKRFPGQGIGRAPVSGASRISSLSLTRRASRTPSMAKLLTV
jgi:transposase